MPLSHLVVIPCPSGLTPAGARRVSVYLAPRLREAGTLADYDIWRSWGDRVANLRFRVYNGNVATTVPVTVVSAPVDPAVWRAVFGANAAAWSKVAVEPFAFVDRTTAGFFGFDGVAAHSTSDSIYAAIEALSGQPIDATAIEGQIQDPAVDDLVAAGEAYLAPIGNGNEPTAPPSEFHTALRYAASHPDLLRRLGLVFDLELTFPAGVVPTELQIRTNFPYVAVGGAPVLDFDSRLQVPSRMKVDAANLPVVRLPQYRTGRWVNFAAGKYVIGQGSTPETVSAVASMRRDARAAGARRAFEPPAIDEAGIRINNVGVVDMLRDQLEHSVEVEDATNLWLRFVIDPATGAPTEPPAIFAEDVAAGVRWDVKDLAKTTFRSLHQRTGPDGYDFPRNAALTINPPADEGWSSLAISTDGTTDYQPAAVGQFPNGELPPITLFKQVDHTQWRVDGDVVMWNGWSLSANPPGRVLDSAGNAVVVDPNTPAPDDPAQVAIDYRAVPGTLERLRFNHVYVMRGRCVDLCGNSEAVGATELPTATSNPILYGRLNPVPSPTVVRRSSRPVPGVGDHVTTIVIKSELNQSDALTPKSDRMLFPARVNQLRLERHGLPAADGIDVADYGFLADRDARTLEAQLLADPMSGETVAGAAVTATGVTPGPAKQRALYMPDPATDGIAFHDLPKGRVGRSVVMGTGNWPDPESVILELAAGSAAPRTTASQRKVTVTLPKGTTVSCSVSAAIDDAWLPHFKRYAKAPLATQRAIKPKIVAGQDVLYSPRQSITLVHAVRLPLTSPTLGAFTASRTDLGQTTAVVAALNGVHRATTDRLVLPCTWDGPDLRSDPSGLTIGLVGGDILTDAVVPLPTSTADATTLAISGLVLDLLDTRRHRVTVTSEAFCRYSEYFTERRALVVLEGVAQVLDPRGFDPLSLVAVLVPSAQPIDVATSFTFDHVAGTITATDAALDGATVQFDYLPRPFSRLSAESATGSSVTFLVPSSSPPPPPVVSRVIPAFARTVTSTATRITVVHDGRVARVHMPMPWNGSGEGEQLGVAVSTDGSLTQWGRDATVVAAGTKTAPTTASFTKAVSRVAGVDGKFSVAGHSVVHDATRDLLTSDVLVNATFGYRPFVQLHLCRYQPEAIDGAHVSTTVATDTMRLGARRTVTVTKGTGRVVLLVVGPDNENVMTARVEEADPGILDAALRWQQVGSAVTLTRSGTRATARFAGTVTLPATGNARRVVIEDAEPVKRRVGNALATEYEIAYREVVEIPTTW